MSAPYRIYGVSSGYTPCACRDCMETAISDDWTKPALCWECKEAGCDADGESACCVEPELEESEDGVDDGG